MIKPLVKNCSSSAVISSSYMSCMEPSLNMSSISKLNCCRVTKMCILKLEYFLNYINSVEAPKSQRSQCSAVSSTCLSVDYQKLEQQGVTVCHLIYSWHCMSPTVGLAWWETQMPLKAWHRDKFGNNTHCSANTGWLIASVPNLLGKAKCGTEFMYTCSCSFKRVSSVWGGKSLSYFKYFHIQCLFCGVHRILYSGSSWNYMVDTW